MESVVHKYKYHSHLPADPHRHSITDHRFCFGMSLAILTKEPCFENTWTLEGYDYDGKALLILVLNGYIINYLILLEKFSSSEKRKDIFSVWTIVLYFSKLKCQVLTKCIV